MYLKRLELHGFKTFADHTDLEFTPGITAIVGPNGSGKSNIFDAIRWTLGEMSFKSLRSGRMDDVIFGGSDARRAMGMGEVSLTINNDSGVLPVAYAEVTVTRRANRGGEGEYVLNTVPCRLRDIQMLFLGTGLGGRSYSLIGQGQVDSVLSAGPDARRVLLEEAAGLARYKRRRREAKRRLLHAGTHLARVRDVLAELTAQMEALRVQAEAATQYQAYTTEVRELELALQVDDARRLQAALRRIATQIDAVQTQRQTLAASAAETGQAIDRDRARAAEMAQQWEEAQRTLLRLVEDLSARDAAMQVLGERVRATAAQRDRLMADLRRVESQLAQVDADLADLRGQAVSVGARRDELLDALRAAEDDQGSAERAQREVEEALGAMRAEVADLAAARTRAAHDLARLDERAASLEGQVTALTSKRIALTRDAERLAGLAAQLEEALAGVLAERDHAAARGRDLAAGRAGLAQDLEACEAELRTLQGDAQVTAQTLGFLEEMHRRLAGYEQGVREILLAKQEHPERFAGIRGPVLDLLRVAAPHRAAVEAALGRTLFSLVAASVEDVKGGLTYLRGNGQGSASFIPIELVPARPAAALPVGAGIVGRATDLVELTDGAREIVDALLGDVVVVAALDDAVALRRAGFPGRLATLDGELLSPDGVISFRGKPDGEALLLGRAEQIAALRERQAALARAIERTGGRRTALADQLAAMLEQLAAMEEEIARAEAAMAEQQAALAPVQLESARLPLARDEVEQALRQLHAQRDDVRAETARLRADEAELTQAIREREAVAAELDAGLRVSAERARAAGAALTEARVQLAEASGTLEALQTRVDDHVRDAEALTARRAQLDGERTVLDGEHHHLTHSLGEAERARDAAAGEQGRTRDALGALAEERAAVQQRLADLEGQWRQAQDALREVEEQAHRLDVRRAQAETEFAAAVRRIGDEFGVRWEDVIDVRLPAGRDEAQGRIEALRGLLAALGPVNLRAVEEHAAVSARVLALRGQADDLDRARAALGALIRRLDEVLRVRFAETFAAVNEEFNRLFVRLFAGGRAQLFLVEGEPGTEQGIEIEAQLPGKKMRSLSALSGGERVLVALSLIFAMLRVHPSPFCIFDEVEAALDDANTRKFTTLLRELAERTQVLIVTHNKGTMEAADVLYGVTMETPGVSTIISMRLTKSGTPEPVPVG